MTHAKCPSCELSSGLYYADIGPRILQCDNCGWWEGKADVDDSDETA